MKSRVVWALVALNVVLLCLSVVRLKPAQAQARRPDDYMLIPGEVQGGTAEIVYVLDNSTDRLSGMYFDQSTHQLRTMTTLNLAQVFQNAGR
jgi:hypothetical protein